MTHVEAKTERAKRPLMHEPDLSRRGCRAVSPGGQHALWTADLLRCEAWRTFVLFLRTSRSYATHLPQ